MLTVLSISRNIIEELHGFHTNLLRLLGWVIPEVDVLHVVMDKADRGLLHALQEGLPLYRRLRIALDVAEGLKALHDIDYIYEDLKPGNILVCITRLLLIIPLSQFELSNSSSSIKLLLLNDCKVSIILSGVIKHEMAK